MSTVKALNFQIGQSLTATNNFTLYQPSSPDGTVRLGNGNAGSVTDLVTVNSSGNVGIGTSSPGYKLEVAYGSTSDALVITGSVDNTTPYLSFKASNGGSSYIRGRVRGTAPDSTAGGLAFDTGASGSMSEKMRLDSSGNLGLGVTPSAWGSSYKALEIGGSGTSLFSGTGTIPQTYLTANAYFNGTNWIYKGSYAALQYEQSGGTHKWNIAPSGTAGNAISFTQAMTLDASGNLLVGTTTTTSITQGFYITPGAATLFDMGHASGSSSGNYYGLFRYAGTVIGSITQNGTTGVLYNTSSDQRLKENIVDAPSAIDSVNAIKVRSFDWKADGSHVDYGYIAQELLEVAPEAVHVPIDADEMMGVDFGKLTPRLVKAIQELSQEIETLKGKIA